MSQRIQITLNNDDARLHGERGLAYAAGFFDGEGCVHIARQKHAGRRLGHVFGLVVSLSQNHLQRTTPCR